MPEELPTEKFWKYVDPTKIMDSKLGVNFIRDDEPVIRPPTPLSPSVDQEQNAVMVCMSIFSFFNFLTLVKYGRDQSHPKFGIQMPLLPIIYPGIVYYKPSTGFNFGEASIILMQCLKFKIIQKIKTDRNMIRQGRGCLMAKRAMARPV